MKISEILRTKAVTVSCELFPPKQGGSLSNTREVVREIAGLRLALQDVATRDFVRSELRDMLEDLRAEIAADAANASSNEAEAEAEADGAFRPLEDGHTGQ